MVSPPEQLLGFSSVLHEKSGELQIRRDGRVVTLMHGDKARRCWPRWLGQQGMTSGGMSGVVRRRVRRRLLGNSLGRLRAVAM